MLLFHAPTRRGAKVDFRALAVTVFLVLPLTLVAARESQLDIMHIGTSGDLVPAKEASKEKGNLATLRNFIRDETGLNNDIVRQKNWRELADKMSKGELHIGAFQGYEFAWATEQHPNLKPLALAINLNRYPIVCVVTNRDDQAKDFAGLQGQSLSLPDTGKAYLRLFVEKESQAKGKALKDFFSKVSTDQSVEDALDDAVDGKVQAVVVERGALEAYKQRKPGRYAKLKEVAKSEPFPPIVIAYYEKVLDDDIRKRFQDGLFDAIETEKGKTMLTLFHLTGFEMVPDDFGKVVAATRKAYPPPKSEMK